MVDKARRGDVGAFEELYHAYSRMILFNAGILLDDKKETEDAAQEVVVLMFKNIRALKSPYAFKTWLQRIIFSVCCRYNKKGGGARVSSIEDDKRVYDLPDDNSESMPEEAALNKSRNEELFEAIQRLPKKQRDSIIMFYYNEMTYAEIAEAQGVSVQTVSTNILKGRKNLKLAGAANAERSAGAAGLEGGRDGAKPARNIEQCNRKQHNDDAGDAYRGGYFFV